MGGVELFGRFMTLNKVWIGSVTLNLLLAGVLLLPKRKEPARPVVAPEAEPVVAPRVNIRDKVVTVTVPGSGFRWHQLESSDFQQYMANLRGIGCPEETIRDLVIAEVNKLYAPKFAALMGQAQHYDYWKPASKKSREGLGKQLEALRNEKRELLKTLVGIEADPSEEWARITVDELVEQGRFSFLSAEKQKQVQEILARYNLDGESDPKRVREKRREELVQVLSPEELYQFDLRDSNASESVRGRFGSADLTEAEYKKLFDLRKAYEDEVGAVADFGDPEKARKRSEARKLLEEAYRNALGDERMKEVSRQQDPGWRSLAQVGQQFNLDQQTLDRAYDYQQVAGEQISKLFSDPNLPREKRREAMDLLNAELQRNLAGILGETAYQEFRKSGPRVTLSTGGDAFVLPTVPGRGALPVPREANIIIQQTK